jgi:hypothetical protein
VVLTVVAFLCWYAGLGRLGVERAGVFAGLVPVASLAGAAALDRAVPTPAQLAGTVAVALALVSALRHRDRRAGHPGAESSRRRAQYRVSGSGSSRWRRARTGQSSPSAYGDSRSAHTAYP